MNESDTPLHTRPVRPEERFMQEHFTEAIANQSKQMDALAQKLLVIELALPGLYATSLKLVSGTDKTEFTLAIAIAFGCWLLVCCFNFHHFRHNPTTIQRH